MILSADKESQRPGQSVGALWVAERCTGRGLSSVVLWCYVVPKSYTGGLRFSCATTSSAGTTPFAVGQL